MHLTCFCLLSLLLFVTVHSQSCPEWGYDHLDWASLCPEYALCASGMSQSPINIDNVMEDDGSLSVLHHDYEHQHSAKIFNNGHTVEVEVEEGSYLLLGDGHAELLQFHFHSRSEHLMEGTRHALEAHFVHRYLDTLAVVAVLFEVGNHNPWLQTIVDVLPMLQNKDDETSIDINPASLFSQLGNGYFHYDGSLTTPPCSEGDPWFVYEDVLTLSQEQFMAFHDILLDNHRPAQPLNGRIVYHFTPPAASLLVCEEGEGCGCTEDDAVEQAQLAAAHKCSVGCGYYSHVLDNESCGDLLDQMDCETTVTRKCVSENICPSGFYWKAYADCVCSCHACECEVTMD